MRVKSIEVPIAGQLVTIDSDMGVLALLPLPNVQVSLICDETGPSTYLHLL